MTGRSGTGGKSWQQQRWLLTADPQAPIQISDLARDKSATRKNVFWNDSENVWICQDGDKELRPVTVQDSFAKIINSMRRPQGKGSRPQRVLSGTEDMLLFGRILERFGVRHRIQNAPNRNIRHFLGTRPLN